MHITEMSLMYILVDMTIYIYNWNVFNIYISGHDYIYISNDMNTKTQLNPPLMITMALEHSPTLYTLNYIPLY